MVITKIPQFLLKFILGPGLFFFGGGDGGAKKTVAVKHVRFVKKDAQTRQIKNVVNRHSHQAEIF